jgi:hypothetical protein
MDTFKVAETDSMMPSLVVLIGMMVASLVATACLRGSDLLAA